MSTNVTASPRADRNKGLAIGLWVAQILLALAFGMAGWMKLATPYAELVKNMPGMAALPEGLLRFIGLAEVAGAAGMILPAATGILPVLTAWAGVGFATIMGLAAAFHLARGEAQSLPVLAALFLLSAFVAWGRFGKGRRRLRSEHVM